jgi:hypothetical protein
MFDVLFSLGVLVKQKRQDTEAPYAEGNDDMTGHIISTTIDGKNGEPWQVSQAKMGFP